MNNELLRALFTADDDTEAGGCAADQQRNRVFGGKRLPSPELTAN